MSRTILAYLTLTAFAFGFVLALLVLPVSSPVTCSNPTAPAGTTVTVDASGNASAPWNGTGYGLVCGPSGTWQRLP